MTSTLALGPNNAQVSVVLFNRDGIVSNNLILLNQYYTQSSLSSAIYALNFTSSFDYTTDVAR